MSSSENESLPADKGTVQQDSVIVMFKLQFGKACTDLSMSPSATVGDLKQEAHELLGIPPAMQKLLIKGQIKPDGTTLQEAGINRGLRVMLIGSRCMPLGCDRDKLGLLAGTRTKKLREVDRRTSFQLLPQLLLLA